GGVADRVVGGQSGGNQRGDVERLEPGLKCDHGSGVGQQLVGHPAVDVHARDRGIDAVGVVADPARLTQPATGEGVHDDRVAGTHVGYRIADVADPAGIFVSQKVGQLRLLVCFSLSLDHVEVRAAYPGGADVDGDVP